MSWTDKGIDMTTKTYAQRSMDLYNVLYKLADISDKSDWPVSVRHNKASEELGELATAVMVEQGFIKHKKLKETSIAEGADTIICVLDVLFASHLNTSTGDVLAALTEQLELKSVKWAEIVKNQGSGPATPAASKDEITA